MRFFVKSIVFALRMRGERGECITSHCLGASVSWAGRGGWSEPLRDLDALVGIRRTQRCVIGRRHCFKDCNLAFGIANDAPHGMRSKPFPFGELCG